MQFTTKMENNFLDTIYFGDSLYDTILNEAKDDDNISPIDNFETYFEQYVATGEFEEKLKAIESNIGNLHKDNPSIEDLQNNIKDVNTNNIKPEVANNLSNATQSMSNAADNWENLMDDFLGDESMEGTIENKPKQTTFEPKQISPNNTPETQVTNSTNNTSQQNVSTQAQEEEDILNDMF